MARSALSDVLSVHAFWLMDVAPVEALALPIFSPLMGFSSITAPEMSLETHDVVEGNWLFHKKVIKRADVSEVTLMRGSTWYDADFYRWTLAALTGDTGGGGGIEVLTGKPSGQIGGVTPRRDLLLIQFMVRQPISNPALAAAAATAGTLGLVGSAATQANVAVSGAAQVGVTAGLTAGAGALGVAFGPFEFAPRLPAKAWMLHGCLPTRYKAAGDFDASSGALSMSELSIAVDFFEEISLTS